MSKRCLTIISSCRAWSLKKKNWSSKCGPRMMSVLLPFCTAIKKATSCLSGIPSLWPVYTNLGSAWKFWCTKTAQYSMFQNWETSSSIWNQITRKWHRSELSHATPYHSMSKQSSTVKVATTHRKSWQAHSWSSSSHTSPAQNQSQSPRNWKT